MHLDSHCIIIFIYFYFFYCYYIAPGNINSSIKICLFLVKSRDIQRSQNNLLIFVFVFQTPAYSFTTLNIIYWPHLYPIRCTDLNLMHFSYNIIYKFDICTDSCPLVNSAFCNSDQQIYNAISLFAYSLKKFKMMSNELFGECPSQD